MDSRDLTLVASIVWIAVGTASVGTSIAVEPMPHRQTAVLVPGDLEKIDDFDTAFSLARQALQDAVETKKELEEASKKEAVVQPEIVAKLTASLANSLSDAVKYFELAFTLVKTADDKKELPQARYLYAHVNLNLKKYYEAAVLAEFVARTTEKDDPLALDSAYLAMAAFGQAFNESKASNDQKGEDLQMNIRACTRIIEHWPSSGKANDASMLLGLIFGMKRPDDVQLKDWHDAAELHLRDAIQNLTKAIPDDAPSPDGLIATKLTLARIFHEQGRDDEALELLVDNPCSIVNAIEVADEAMRPQNGVTSRQSALNIYTLLFDVSVKITDFGEARRALKTAFKIANAGGKEFANWEKLLVAMEKQLEK